MLVIGLKREVLILSSVAGDQIGDFFELSTIRREVRLVELVSMPCSFAPMYSIVQPFYAAYSLHRYQVYLH